MGERERAVESLAAKYAKVERGPTSQIDGKPTWIAANPFLLETRQVKMDAFVVGYSAALARVEQLEKVVEAARDLCMASDKKEHDIAIKKTWDALAEYQAKIKG